MKGPTAPSLQDLDPAATVDGISGIRVYNVGQGDAIAILDETGRPFLQVDYGGRQANPHAHTPRRTMPLQETDLIILTHWDEDHWCTAPKNVDAEAIAWLVPRQRTSPRAVKYSAKLDDIYCFPEAQVGQVIEYRTRNDNVVRFEKIARRPPRDRDENCNATGIALSIQHENQVILLPGDAPFDQVSHYHTLERAGTHLRGVVAFHHGSDAHWTRRTGDPLWRWMWRSSDTEVIFSYAEENGYGHPYINNYLPGCRLDTPWWPHRLIFTPRDSRGRGVNLLF